MHTLFFFAPRGFAPALPMVPSAPRAAPPILPRRLPVPSRAGKAGRQHLAAEFCLVNYSAARSRCFGVLIRRAWRWGKRKTAQKGKRKSSPGLQSS